MSAIRVVIVALLAAGVAAALTGWILNQQQTSAQASVCLLSRAASPIAPLGGVAGATPAPASAETANPLADDPTAVAEGHKLFMSMNCAGCHGYDAKGGMGPDLTDTYWRYGGTPERLYEFNSQWTAERHAGVGSARCRPNTSGNSSLSSNPSAAPFLPAWPRRRRRAT